MVLLARILWFAPLLLAALYAFGALVHALNISGLTGHGWEASPLKWRLLDIVYLAADVAVAAGLGLRQRWGPAVFFATALSQILLYTVFRAWVLDVPEAFAPTSAEAGALDDLVALHLATMAAMAAHLAVTEKIK